MAFELRSFAYIDRMQPQYAAYIGTILPGPNPIAGNAELFLEVEPAVEVYTIADIALKAADVRPGVMTLERQYGVLELHADNEQAVRRAGEAILQHLELTEQDSLKPSILSTEIITSVDNYQAQLINQSRMGSMIVPGQSMLVIEIAPAGWVTLAANEVEKAADIVLVRANMIGPAGRFIVAGTVDQMAVARDVVVRAVESVGGRG